MRSEQVKSAQPSCDRPKKRSGTSAPISLEDLMEKEVQSSTQDGAIRELSVLADPSSEQLTKIKRKIRILDHPKNLIEVLCARLVIENVISGCRELIIIDKLNIVHLTLKNTKSVLII